MTQFIHVLSLQDSTLTEANTVQNLEDQTLQRKQGQEVVWGALSQEPGLDSQVSWFYSSCGQAHSSDMLSGPDFCPCKTERRD